MYLREFTVVSSYVHVMWCVQDLAKSGWDRVLAAFSALEISDMEVHVLWSALAAIFLLAAADVTGDAPAYRSQFIRNAHFAHKAAELLGVQYNDLHKTIFGSADKPPADDKRTGLVIIYPFRTRAQPS